MTFLPRPTCPYICTIIVKANGAVCHMNITTTQFAHITQEAPYDPESNIITALIASWLWQTELAITKISLEGAIGTQYCDCRIFLEMSFSIEGNDGFSGFVRISICISAQRIGVAFLILQRGTTIRTREARLPHNIGSTLSIVRIDWAEDKIKFFVKGTLVGFFYDHQGDYIPDQPMHISVAVIPDNMDSPFKNESIIYVNLNLYRARYIRWDYKSELRKIEIDHSSGNVTLIIFLIFFSLIAFGFTIWSYRYCIRASTLKGHDISAQSVEHYILLEPT